jgi:hypothetical protein
VKFSADDRYHPGLYPTQEELLEINFWSIVSDLRSAVRGTLITRTIGDYSSGWNEYVSSGIPETRRSMDTMEAQAQRSERIARRRTPNPRVPKKCTREVKVKRAYKRQYEGAAMSGRVRRLMHIFISNGLNRDEAYERAKKLLLAPDDNNTVAKGVV